MKRVGFTLIELLVVVAVIALIAALLFPAFEGARERARQSACANNLKQIGAAIRLYANDWDDFLPLQYGTNKGWDCEQIWKILIDPYLKTQAVWVCPSNPAGGDPDFRFVTGKVEAGVYQAEEILTWPNLPISYVQSRSLFDNGIDLHKAQELNTNDPNRSGTTRSFSDIRDPSGIIMVYEAADDRPQFPYGLGAGVDDLGIPLDPGKVLGVWHHGGSNWLFADQHVRWMTLRQTLVPQVLWMPGGDPAWGPIPLTSILGQMDQYPQYRK